MPLEIQHKLVQTNTTPTFTFSNTISRYLIGISNFFLTYGSDEDHHVLETSVSLSSNGPSGNTLDVEANAVLRDSSGNGIDNGQSTILVAVLAWTGSAPGTLNFTEQTGIPNDGHGDPIQIPGSPLRVRQALLAGHELAFSGGDHHVQYIGAGASSNVQGNTAFIDGSAQMYDASGNSAATATIGGGIIMSSDSDPGFAVKSLNNQQTLGIANVNFGGILSSVSAASALITQWHASFPNGKDHHVKAYGAGSPSLTINGTDVTLFAPRAILYDDSKNNQNDATSNVSFAVVAVP